MHNIPDGNVGEQKEAKEADNLNGNGNETSNVATAGKCIHISVAEKYLKQQKLKLKHR